MSQVANTVKLLDRLRVTENVLPVSPSGMLWSTDQETKRWPPGTYMTSSERLRSRCIVPDIAMRLRLHTMLVYVDLI